MTCKEEEGLWTSEEENSKTKSGDCPYDQTLTNPPESDLMWNKFSGKVVSDNDSDHIQEHPSTPSGLKEHSRVISKLEHCPSPSESAEEKKEREKPHTSEDGTSGETWTNAPGSDSVPNEFNTKETTTSKFQAVPQVENGHTHEDPSASTVDEDDLPSSKSLNQYPYLPCKIFNGFKVKPERGTDVHHYLDVVFGLARFNAHVSPGRAWKRVMTSAPPKLLGLLLLASLLGGASASPLSARVQGNGRAEQGQAYSLTCVLEGLPGIDTSSYIWYKDGDVIREETQPVLTFPRLTQGDAGMYQCGPKRPPRLGIPLSHPFQMLVFEVHKMIPKPMLGAWMIPVLHQPFELTCTVFGLPQNHDIHLNYTWFKNFRQIPGLTSKSLLFPSLTREDEGVYMCRAWSGHRLTTSPDSNEKNLHILLPPRVHIAPDAPDAVIRRAAGEELTLTCNVTEAFPWVSTDGYSWSHLPSPQGQLRPLGVRESTLRLGPLTREDSGQYFCQARNDLYAFQGLLPPGNAVISVDVLYIEQIALTADLKANDENRLTLTCSVASNPAARLSWLVDGREVRHVTYNVDHFVVEGAACSKNKTYTCRASNADLPSLEKHASTNIGVVCNGNEPPTVHIEPATSLTIMKRTAGEELILNCKVAEAIPWVPANGFRWSHLPPLQEEYRPLVARESTLRLGPLTREDSGQYSCQANSDLEVIPGRVLSANYSIIVDVVYMEEIILTPDLKVNKEDRVTLTCNVDSNPVAQLSWIIDGREVRHVTANTDHLVLERAACSDNKTYTCRASNADLPSLERHASANVQVVCNENVSGSTTSSLLTHSPLLWLLVMLLMPLIML